MLEELQHKLNYYFKNAELLNRALSRNVITSASTDEAEVLPDYEHLEFVGDRVLNLCITTLLSKLHPSWTPHQLQSFYVHYTRNTDDAALHGGPLYRIAKDLELESHLTLKPGEKLDRKGTRGKLKAGKGKTKEGLLADHMEALLGAVYLDSDHNLNKVISIVETLFKPLGLLDPEHHSVAEFGASSAMWSGPIDEEEDSAEATISTNAKFLQLIESGNHEALITADLDVEQETAENGFWHAIIRDRVNLVKFLVERYAIGLETIKTALEDRDLNLSIRGYLESRYEKIMLDECHHYFSSSAVATASLASIEEVNEAKIKARTEAQNFLLQLFAEGNTPAIEAINPVLSPEIAAHALFLAASNAKPNIVPYLIRHYTITESAIREVLNIEGLVQTIKNFLEAHLKNFGKVKTIKSSEPFPSTEAAISTDSDTVTASIAATGSGVAPIENNGWTPRLSASFFTSASIPTAVIVSSTTSLITESTPLPHEDTVPANMTKRNLT